MTDIKTTGYLTGYMTKTAAEETPGSPAKGYTDPYKAKIKRLTGDIKEGWGDIKEGWDVLKPKYYPEGWVTPLVEAPGIPPTGRSRIPGVKPLFQDGKAKYERTQQQMPPTTQRSYKPGEYVTPASVNDQLLQNLKDPEGNPVSAAEFVAIQKRNYERNHGVPDFDYFGEKDPLIDFDKRNQPVSLDTSYSGKVQASGHPFPPSHFAATNPEVRRIVGIDPNELRENPESEYSTQAPWSASVRKKIREIMDRGADDKPKGLQDGADTPKRKKWLDYHGFKDKPRRSGVDVLGHEGTHNYTGGIYDGSLGKLTKLKPGTSYITDRGAEYTQGVTAGLNAMRDVTGKYLNDPQQVHQLFDEIIADPVILDSIAPEHARVFRTYLTLRETNPELAEKLRNSMARDSQYLVENEPAGDPMVKKASSDRIDTGIAGYLQGYLLKAAARKPGTGIGRGLTVDDTQDFGTGAQLRAAAGAIPGGLFQGVKNVGRGAEGLAEAVAGGVGTIGSEAWGGIEAFTDARGWTDDATNTWRDTAKTMSDFSRAGLKNVGDVYGAGGGAGLRGDRGNHVTKLHDQVMDGAGYGDTAKSLARGSLGTGRVAGAGATYLAGPGLVNAGVRGAAGGRGLVGLAAGGAAHVGNAAKFKSVPKALKSMWSPAGKRVAGIAATLEAKKAIAEGTYVGGKALKEPWLPAGVSEKLGPAQASATEKQLRKEAWAYIKTYFAPSRRYGRQTPRQNSPSRGPYWESLLRNDAFEHFNAFDEKVGGAAWAHVKGQVLANLKQVWSGAAPALPTGSAGATAAAKRALAAMIPDNLSPNININTRDIQNAVAAGTAGTSSIARALQNIARTAVGSGEETPATQPPLGQPSRRNLNAEGR